MAQAAVRRSHAAALLGLAALVLLLLARLPAPPSRHHPHPYATPPPFSPASSTSSASLSVAVTDLTAPPGPRPVLVRDLYESGYSSPPPALCPALGARLKLLILVTSAPSHAVARDAVRLTWGHYAKRSDVALGFVLGAPPLALLPALAAEDALYNDLIMGRFVDSYSNLTLKTLAMLEWADTFCPRAPRLLKTDDDMFINVPHLLHFATTGARANASRTIWGRVFRYLLPLRNTNSKTYVPESQFVGRMFPDFATGAAYLLTADCVRPLLAVAPSFPYLRLEDVFVTGVLAARLGLTLRHASEFYNRKMTAHPCVLQRGIAVHSVCYHEQFDFWRKLFDNSTHCGPDP